MQVSFFNLITNKQSERVSAASQLLLISFDLAGDLSKFYFHHLSVLSVFAQRAVPFPILQLTLKKTKFERFDHLDSSDVQR